MTVPKFRTLLLFAAAAFAVLAPISSAGSAATIAPRGPQGLRGLTGKTGAAGKVGAAGKLGLTGAPGLRGSSGPEGGLGLAGAAGKVGATGAAGLQGATGSAGAAGALGPQGVQGSPGATGAAGPDGVGTAGALGPQGPTGPTGPSGPSQYAYIYSVTGQTVAIDGNVVFDSGGTLTSGFTRAAGAGPGITFVTAGTYKVTYSISATEVSQWGLFVGATLVPGSVYGSGAGVQQNTGQAIFTAVAGDVLTLRNHTTASAVGLAATIGGTQATTNASVLIEQLG